jgi:hypothetical protein
MAGNFERLDDFLTIYSNNVQFENSAWDMKLIFGQLDQSHDPAIVEQNIAVTMAWAQAKIAAYYMFINLAIHQGQNGPIQVPSAVIPARPDPEDPSLDVPGRRTVRYLAWLHDQFFGADPYIPPSIDESLLK